METLNTSPEYFDGTVRDYAGCRIGIRSCPGGPSGLMTSYAISRRGQLVAIGNSTLTPREFRRELRNAVDRARGEASSTIINPQRTHPMRRVG